MLNCGQNKTLSNCKCTPFEVSQKYSGTGKWSDIATELEEMKLEIVTPYSDYQRIASSYYIQISNVSEVTQEKVFNDSLCPCLI